MHGLAEGQFGREGQHGNCTARPEELAHLRPLWIASACGTDPGLFDPGNLAILRSALIDAVCHHRASDLFHFTDADGNRGLPFTNFSEMLHFLLGVDTAERSAAAELTDALLQKMRYRRESSARHRVDPLVSSALFDLLVNGVGRKTAFHLHTLTPLREAFLKGLGTRPPGVPVSTGNIEAIFGSRVSSRHAEQILPYQFAVLDILEKSQPSDVFLADLVDKFLVGAHDEAAHPAVDSWQSKNLAALRQLLFKRLREHLFASGTEGEFGHRGDGVMASNGLWHAFQQADHASRPPAIRHAFDELILELLAKRMLTDPEDLREIAAAIVSNRLPLQRHQPLFARYPFDFITKLVSAQHLPLNDFLLDNVRWLDAKVALSIIEKHALLLPETQTGIQKKLLQVFIKDFRQQLGPLLAAPGNVGIRNRHSRADDDGAMSERAVATFKFIVEDGAYDKLREAIEIGIRMALIARDGEPAESPAPYLAPAFFKAIAAVLENRLLNTSAARKINALNNLLTTQGPPSTDAKRARIVKELAQIDAEATIEHAIRRGLGISRKDWNPMRQAALALAGTWSDWKTRLGDVAAKGYPALGAQAVASAARLRNTPLFEPYVMAVAPFLTIVDVRKMLEQIKAKKLICTPDFELALAHTNAYFDCMKKMDMVDEDDERAPLKLHVTSMTSSAV
ncbi:MAG: hypothetical protein ACRYF5_16785, partial [Janthinobacterium lividum]